jgi:hypothetical protein
MPNEFSMLNIGTINGEQQSRRVRVAQHADGGAATLYRMKNGREVAATKYAQFNDAVEAGTAWCLGQVAFAGER